MTYRNLEKVLPLDYTGKALSGDLIIEWPRREAEPPLGSMPTEEAAT